MIRCCNIGIPDISPMRASFGLSTGLPLTSLDWSQVKVLRHIATKEIRTEMNCYNTANKEEAVPRVIEMSDKTFAGTEDWGFS